MIFVSLYWHWRHKVWTAFRVLKKCFVLHRRWCNWKLDTSLLLNWRTIPPHPPQGVCISTLCLFAFLFPQHAYKTLTTLSNLLPFLLLLGSAAWITFKWWNYQCDQKQLRMFENRLLFIRQKSIWRKHRSTGMVANSPNSFLHFTFAHV